jgi:hypothetical protein
MRLCAQRAAGSEYSMRCEPNGLAGCDGLAFVLLGSPCDGDTRMDDSPIAWPASSWVSSSE